MRALSLAILVLAASPVAAQAAAITPGAYADAMLIGFDPASQTVSGYFDMQVGDPPGFSCIFYLSGRLSGASAPVATYFPQDPTGDLIKGQLSVEAAGRFLVRLPKDHGGCANAETFADAQNPTEFTLQAAHPWIAVAVIRSAKAYFYDTPGAAAHRKGYVVQGDGVGVRARKPGWLEVDFTGGTATVSGWIKDSDVYPPG